MNVTLASALTVSLVRRTGGRIRLWWVRGLLMREVYCRLPEE